MNPDLVAIQLGNELNAIARNLARLIDTSPDPRLLYACHALAVDMCGDDTDQAAYAVRLVMAARWPDGTQPHPAWWRTHLGRAIARWVGPGDREFVTRAVAAAMLGVHPGTVAQWTARGKLEQGADGSIARSSVLLRLSRTQPPASNP